MTETLMIWSGDVRPKCVAPCGALRSLFSSVIREAIFHLKGMVVLKLDPFLKRIRGIGNNHITNESLLGLKLCVIFKPVQADNNGVARRARSLEIKERRRF
jgi:hypothetical protein